MAGERLRGRWLHERGSLFPGLRQVRFPSAGAATPGLFQASAEFEVGRVEGAGVPALAPPAVGPFDQLLGQLGGGDPDAGNETGILIGVLGLEPCLPYAHREPSPGCGTTSSVESYGVKVSDCSGKT